MSGRPIYDNIVIEYEINKHGDNTILEAVSTRFDKTQRFRKPGEIKVST